MGTNPQQKVAGRKTKEVECNDRGSNMKPGFTLAEAGSIARKIAMRQERIKHIHTELIRLNDCMRILEDEINELCKLA